MKPDVERIPLDRITLDPRLQMRAGGTRDDLAREYAEILDDLPPSKVVSDGKTSWLTEGWHRYRAHEIAEITDMPCSVRLGTFLDALVEAASANHDHGLKRTNEDKRKAVCTLLAENEAGGHGWSNRQVSRMARVSPGLVDLVVSEIASGEIAYLGNPDNELNSGGDASSDSASDPTPAHEEANGVPPPPAPGLLKDPFGMTVPEKLRPVFGPEPEAKRREALSLLRKLSGLVNEYASSPAGDYLRHELRREGKGDEDVRYRDTGLTDLARRLKQLAPYCSVCPYCHAKNRSTPSCNCCAGRGWVPASVFERTAALPPDYLEALHALKEEAP